MLQVTDRIDEARQFASVGDAIDCWRAVSQTHPYRMDGRLNRPMTAFSVELTPLDRARDTQSTADTSAAPVAVKRPARS